MWFTSSPIIVNQTAIKRRPAELRFNTRVINTLEIITAGSICLRSILPLASELLIKQRLNSLRTVYAKNPKQAEKVRVPLINSFEASFEFPTLYYSTSIRDRTDSTLIMQKFGDSIYHSTGIWSCVILDIFTTWKKRSLQNQRLATGCSVKSRTIENGPDSVVRSFNLHFLYGTCIIDR